MAIEKLPPNLKEKWFFFVDECQEDRPDLTLLEKWLARMAFVHEGMPSSKSERKEDDRPNANKEKRFSKSSNISASSNPNETKQMRNNNCPLADGTHKIWNCPIFKNMKFFKIQNFFCEKWSKRFYCIFFKFDGSTQNCGHNLRKLTQRASSDRAGFKCLLDWLIQQNEQLQNSRMRTE